MKFFHFLTYAIVLGFFAVACTRESRPVATAHLNAPQSTTSRNYLLDNDLLPVADGADSLSRQLPQQ
ncbi:hypothetical protein [Taibaiella soli]|uniref:hypothetical protein n=1 Tax=Taibaiella soli TaxID=1649169 RepID=UPI000F4FA2D1|nr:hypothetical protein [Taibaiella soli]